MIDDFHIHGCCGHHGVSRRAMLSMSALALAAPAMLSRAAAYPAMPKEVAGIAIPDSALAERVIAYARKAYPPFLFNHCMRTYLFGALAMKKLGRRYDAEEAFTGAALHDLGLMPAFESKRAPFEIDGANAAEKFLMDNGIPKERAEVVWHSIVFHDKRWVFAKHQGTEAQLVTFGAGADVVGPRKFVNQPQIDAVVAAFPRLQFKKQFTAALIGHCKRKPRSQTKTWLEGLCREQVPGAFTDTVEQEIAAGPFAE